MKRGGPLQRKTPMRRTRMKRSVGDDRNSYAKRPRGLAYMEWVHTQPCLITVSGAAGLFTPRAELYRCDGPIEADHLGERIAGYGTRAPDATCGALCKGHHWQRTGYRRFFGNITNELRRAWCDAAIEHTQTTARAYGVVIPDC